MKFGQCLGLGSEAVGREQVVDPGVIAVLVASFDFEFVVDGVGTEMGAIEGYFITIAIPGEAVVGKAAKTAEWGAAEGCTDP